MLDRYMLDGTWQLSQLTTIQQGNEYPDLSEQEWFPAQVPGEVHQDLIAAGKMENIFASKAAAQAGLWVCDADWVYQYTFSVPASILNAPKVFLHFDSIDTFSDVFVNGILVGTTQNAFIRESFCLSSIPLKAHNNVVTVHIKGHQRMTERLAALALETCAVDSESGRIAAASRNVTRRSQRTYSSDIMGFGFYVLGIGIPKSVWLEAYADIHIEDTIFRVLTADAQQASIVLEAQILSDASNLSAVFTLTDEQDSANTHQWIFPVIGGKAGGTVQILHPTLWWPNGYGKPNLHRLKVAVACENDILDSTEIRVGIRKVDLIRALPNRRATFQFRINAQSIYIFGGNMMSINFITATGNKAQSQRLLSLAVNANLNLLRLWGGGNNESDWFYDMCDEMGLMIWKESHLHFMPYPDHDRAFVENVTRETREMLRYMRNHACFAVYCGANEMQEGYQAYNYRAMMDRFYGSRFIHEIFPALAHQMCPEVPFVPDSPHGTDLAQSPVEGDTHTWGNFFNATKDPLFSAETCWFDGSHPRPQTIESVMGIRMEDFASPGWHQRWYELTGRELQGNHKYGEYYWLDTLADYLRSLEIEQMLADYQGMFYLRCRSSSCNGLIYWPFNKGGMFIGFGCIDCEQRPLMAYYQLARAFKPVVCHLYRDIDDIRLVAANATWYGIHASVHVSHMTADGKVLREWQENVHIAQGNANRLMHLENYYASIQDRKREYLHVDVFSNGERICEDTLYFCMWPEFKNTEATLSCNMKRVGDGYQITVTSDAFVKMLSIQSDTNLMLSDNYFTMMMGETRSVIARPLTPCDAPLEITLSALDCTQTFTCHLEA